MAARVGEVEDLAGRDEVRDRERRRTVRTRCRRADAPRARTAPGSPPRVRTSAVCRTTRSTRASTSTPVPNPRGIRPWRGAPAARGRSGVTARHIMTPRRASILLGAMDGATDGALPRAGRLVVRRGGVRAGARGLTRHGPTASGRRVLEPGRRPQAPLRDPRPAGRRGERAGGDPTGRRPWPPRRAPRRPGSIPSRSSTVGWGTSSGPRGRRRKRPPTTKGSTDVLRKWVDGDDRVMEDWIRASDVGVSGPASPPTPVVSVPDESALPLARPSPAACRRSASARRRSSAGSPASSTG